MSYAVNDAKAVAQTLVAQGRSLFRPGEVKVLADKEVTRAGIEEAFTILSARIAPRDVFVLYLSGHGLASDGRYHFLPWDLIYENEAALHERGVSEEDLKRLLALIPAQKSLIVIDTCQSGSALHLAGLLRGPDVKPAISRLMRLTGRAVLAATSDKKVALEGYKDHGVFTYALLEGLRGEADRRGNHDHQVTVDELSAYLQEEVPRITRQQFGFEQFPMRNVEGQSFPIGWYER